MIKKIANYWLKHKTKNLTRIRFRKTEKKTVACYIPCIQILQKTNF